MFFLAQLLPASIQDKMKSGKVTRTLFVEAKDEIFKLMNMDSFQRFKRGTQTRCDNAF